MANRKNTNAVINWWWTVDRLTLLAIVVIISIGAVMVATASPAVAERIGADGFFFVRRQFLYLLFASVVIFSVSLMSPQMVRRLSAVGFAVGVLLLIAVLFVGVEVKGATRWLHLGPISVQPSEFIKPFFIVLTAGLLSKQVQGQSLHGYKISIVLYTFLVLLLILQPNFGMVVGISMVWGGQLFLAGLPIIWIFVMAFLGIAGVLSAYNFLPHVAKRINSFLDPGEKSYQVKKSIDAFSNGGFFGQGPGQGTVKLHLPDAHTDFIFAVAGEELGLLFCMVIVLLFAFVVIRTFLLALKEKDLFILYAVAGLAMQFGVQALINMGVTLSIIPNTGTTLPFISYGGSSLIAIGIAIGMMLALTRKRYGEISSSVKRQRVMAGA